MIWLLTKWLTDFIGLDPSLRRVGLQAQPYSLTLSLFQLTLLDPGVRTPTRGGQTSDGLQAGPERPGGRFHGSYGEAELIQTQHAARRNLAFQKNQWTATRQVLVKGALDMPDTATSVASAMLTLRATGWTQTLRTHRMFIMQ